MAHPGYGLGNIGVPAAQHGANIFLGRKAVFKADETLDGRVARAAREIGGHHHTRLISITTEWPQPLLQPTIQNSWRVCLLHFDS